MWIDQIGVGNQIVQHGRNTFLTSISRIPNVHEKGALVVNFASIYLTSKIVVDIYVCMCVCAACVANVLGYTVGCFLNQVVGLL